MKRNLKRLLAAAFLGGVGLLMNGCSGHQGGHGHGHVAHHGHGSHCKTGCGHGYYHYPSRPAYNNHHHHTHYAGCGHKTVAYHYY